jgi:nucleoside-diphosphate-sugar epimerase
MRVFLAGATGALGQPLLTRLTEAGHEMTAMTRSPERARRLLDAGATPAVCDVYDADGLREAMVAARPEVVVHALTAIPQRIAPRHMERSFAENDRVREEGTPNLVAAAQAAGARRIVAESIAFAYAPNGAGRPHVESDPLALDASGPWRRSVRALHTLESSVLGADGIEGLVLRFGYFYGPGTGYATDGATCEMVRRRQFPIVGGGNAVWSFVHIDDAAEATLLAVESSITGVCNIVDDDPAAMSEWLPGLAETLGAKAPRRVPALLVRMVSGEYALAQMTRYGGADATRAHEELGWQPRFPTWREGFRASVGEEATVG